MTRKGIHLLGVGSIGTLLAHHIRLSSPSIPLTLLVRSPRDFPEKIKVIRDGKSSNSSGYTVESSLGNESSKDPISSLVITTKTTQTLQAIEPLIPRLSNKSTIALLQNGMGVYQELTSNFFQNEQTRPQFILGTTPHGVSPNSKCGGRGNILHHVSEGQGFIKWGLVNDDSKQIGNQTVENWLFNEQNDIKNEDLDKVLIPKDREDLVNLKNTIMILTNMKGLNSKFILYNELNKELLLKLVINACNNPITAILGRGYLKNGITLSNEYGQDIVNLIIKESSEILLKYLELTQKGIDTKAFEYDQLKKLVYDTILFNSNNISSMAVDVLQKRQTEIDYINGYLIKLGEELGCKSDVNRLIVNMVKFIEETQKDQ
ncbi:uncharacterized protein I206_107083 [Kwoniella pini CBS 10737]|uniref:2-dehydropantoate 2-reductase n=1 Tax=Kwoniella pini CBS 10737 TaxID=1296096 RepID=A0A1B9HZA7_9TREE|nr:uncharacterized protein I206_05373 [Kwoniella pini CBS 10737]OCF48594.1 hypothetical protein I206_05373 [Kwoniella pini CBS 10737]